MAKHRNLNPNLANNFNFLDQISSLSANFPNESKKLIEFNSKSGTHEPF